MSDVEFKIGDRVTLNNSNIVRYSPMWVKRIKKGLHGVVVGCVHNNRIIQWDVPKRAKHPHEWRWGGVHTSELEPEARA